LFASFFILFIVFCAPSNFKMKFLAHSLTIVAVLLGFPGAHGALDVGKARAGVFREMVSRAGIYDTFPGDGPSKPPCDQSCPTHQPPLKVGIIGAGAAGLYSALLLQTLGIDYEILEADGRAGGRLYTHYFDLPAWKKSTPEDAAYYNYYVS
jgi:hypothetical protein